MATSQSVYSQLLYAVNRIPLIDNHAHNILQTYEPPTDYPREMLVSEATGEALKDSVYSLAHMRMLRYLARFLGLPVESTWEQIKEVSKAIDYTSFCQFLIKSSGIQAILIDDGFYSDQCHEISWHDKLTPFPNKRIVRIEALFESIVSNIGRNDQALEEFVAAIYKYTNDTHVVGFKSIAAYRSGLDVKLCDITPDSAARELVAQDLKTSGPARYRVTQHDTVSWLINITLSVISGKGKPLQFHTGLGDNDITLVRSDASLLQPIIKAYPNVPFVLLHSGYPYARQAGYLATVYPNVYLDFGLAIPLLSGDGQRGLIRQLLELCPTNKLLWSSDAALHPERYYLGAVQSKEALSEVLAEYISRKELSTDEAIKIIKRMLFENSNELYSLGIEYIELGSKAKTEGTASDISDQNTGSNLASEYLAHSVPKDLSTNPPPSTLDTLVASLKSQSIKFVRVTWVDYVNLIRYRVIPINHFVSIVGSNLVRSPSSLSDEKLAESGISLVQAALGLVVNDGLTPGVSTSGDHDYKPDFSSIWKPSFAPGHAYMMGRFFHKSHDGGAEFETCPRTILQRVVQRAERELGAQFLVGFETEFILLDQASRPASTGAWSTSRKLQCGPVADCVHDIAQTIIDAGIKLELYHAESADGQYEVVTGPLPPVQAADALIATREIIYNVAQKHKLRATLCPRLYSHQAGSASHVHISVKSPKSSTPSSHPDIPTLPADLACFMSGLLAHLPTVCAFTLPLDASYTRVVDGAWSGGAWVCWGRENKEAPLRLCGSEKGSGFNVELKAFDGLANPYLGLAAALAAGVTGLNQGMELKMRNCMLVASDLTEEKRNEMHIDTRMPTQNIVFEPESDKRTEFVNSWLPPDAWKLYKDVRKYERDTIYEEHKSRNGVDEQVDFKFHSTRHCQEHY